MNKTKNRLRKTKYKTRIRFSEFPKVLIIFLTGLRFFAEINRLLIDGSRPNICSFEYIVWGLIAGPPFFPYKES